MANNCAETWFWPIAGLLALILCMVMMGLSLWSTAQEPIKIISKNDYIASQLDTYEKVKLTGDLKDLSENDRNAVHFLQQAGKVIDSLFWRQYLINNDEIFKAINDTKDYYGSMAGKSGSYKKKHDEYVNLSEYYTINTGPYEVLVDYNPFCSPTNVLEFPAERKKPAEYYPEDITEDEWAQYLTRVGGTPEYDCAVSSVSVIKREEAENGTMALKCHWYSEEYSEYLGQIHDYLLLAASYTDNQSMKTFLEKRAQACLDNSYIESDEFWVDVDQLTNFDITIGPYETYMDGFKGIKAAFESYIGITRIDDTKRISTYSGYLNELQANLPADLPGQGEQPKLSSQVKIIDLIFSSGEAKQASQTLAYNLPNIPTLENQSRQIMLYNVQQAKYENILKPIAVIINDTTYEEIDNFISFDSNFQHTISHEFSHALGPTSTVNGQQINEAIGEFYSAFEEAKADVGSMWSVKYLSDNQRPCAAGQTEACGYAIQCRNANFEGINDGMNYMPCTEYVDRFFRTFLGDLIRTLRFGVSEAHGQAVASYMNNFIEVGAIVVEGTKMTCFTDKMVVKAEELFKFLLETESQGDKVVASDWLKKYGVITDDIQVIIDAVNAGGIKVDIRPEYEEF